MNTTENNKLIAEFMGMRYGEERKFKEGEWTHSIQSLSRFNTDWNWIMEVVEKIEQLGYEVLIGRISCNINSILDRENPISSMVCGDVSKKQSIVYETCVKFVKWYNKQNK